MEWDNRIHKFRFLLRPLSCLYGMGVRFRNMLFDEGIWKEESFDVPVICVVGGECRVGIRLCFRDYVPDVSSLFADVDVICGLDRDHRDTGFGGIDFTIFSIICSFDVIAHDPVARVGDRDTPQRLAHRHIALVVRRATWTKPI